MFGFNIKKKISSALENNVRERRFHNLDTMRKVMLLFLYKDWKEVEPIVQDLRGMRKDVQLWTLQNKKDETFSLPPNARVISSKEISSLTGLSSIVLEEFKSLTYDTLIDLTVYDDNNLMYLLANNSSEFCIGVKETDYDVFDFTLLKDDDMNLPEAYDQIKFYLSNIR